MVQATGSATPQLRGKGTTPLFVLPSTAGGTSGPASLRSRYNAVLLFIGDGPEAERYLQGLAGLYPDILASQARVLVVVPLALEEATRLAGKLALPFPLLADEGGKTTRRMLGETTRSALCITDRYGQVYSLEAAPSVGQLPPPRSALEWLEFILIQCPE